MRKIYLIKIRTKGNLNLYDQLINYKKQFKEDVYEKPPNCNTIKAKLKDQISNINHSIFNVYFNTDTLITAYGICVLNTSFHDKR